MLACVECAPHKRCSHGRHFGPRLRGVPLRSSPSHPCQPVEVTLFLSFPQGVPWHSVPGFKEGGATPLYFMGRNVGSMKKAGDPGFALLFIGAFFQLIATQALYTRWSGRDSRLPHTAMVRLQSTDSSRIFLGRISF